ncbi:MAG: LPS assembly protein LptD, partial [Limnobacter sp.]|nr:LPS assembly protein LptD [Limnobacter sp.]
ARFQHSYLFAGWQVIFERETAFFDLPVMQTLEPRLFYLYTPFVDQSDQPISTPRSRPKTFTAFFGKPLCRRRPCG